MKITTILLLSACLSVSAGSRAQKVTLLQKNVKLEKVFREIRKQTGYVFFYDTRILERAKPVDIHVENVSVEEALKESLQGLPLDFSIEQKTIAIFQKANYSLYKKPANMEYPDMETLIPLNIINGTVNDAQGNPLAGVSVIVKGTNKGTSTTANGSFSIDANVGDVLEFTIVGYQKKSVAVGQDNNISVIMEIDNLLADEIVVTALGIRREMKSLGYSITKVDNKEFSKVHENNFMTSLVGKVAGLDISGAGAGPFGSSRITIRGNTSIAGDNQPLYIINGIPMDNTKFGESSDAAPNWGDNVSSLNGEDIEDVTILKGATAAALYGSRAKNGAIVITTKSGKGQTGFGVEVNSHNTFDIPHFIWELQKEYGQGYGGFRPASEEDAANHGQNHWGEPYDGVPTIQFDGVKRPYSYVKDELLNDFYQTGFTSTNSVAFTGGSKNGSFRLGLTDMKSNDILPNAVAKRNNISFNANQSATKNLIITANVDYIREDIKNRAVISGGRAGLPLTVLMVNSNMPPEALKPGYDENFAEKALGTDLNATNPYYVLNRMHNETVKDRFITALTARWNVLDWLFIQGKVGQDFYTFGLENIVPDGTGFAKNGYMNQQDRKFWERNFEALIGINKDLNTNFSLNVNLGGNLMSQNNEITWIDGFGFQVPQLHIMNNAKEKNVKLGGYAKKINSLFGTAELSYRDLLFLNVTGRNDWFSTLSPESNNFFYLSVGGSFVFSEAFNMPKFINFGKLRMAYASVGGDTDPYSLNLTYGFLGSSYNNIPLGIINQTIVPNSKIRPLSVNEFEVGFDVRMLANRLGIDMAFYNKITSNDITQESISTTSGYEGTWVNVGKLRNKGVELLITGKIINKPTYSWDISGNISFNRSMVLKISNSTDELTLTKMTNAFVKQIEGMEYSQLVGRTIKKNEKGQDIIDATGLPIVTNEVVNFGSGIYKYLAGITTNFNYKNFALSIQVDGKFGAKMYSNTNYNLDHRGMLEGSLPGRKDGIVLPGVTESGEVNTVKVTADRVNNRAIIIRRRQAIDDYVYDASFIKIRNISLTYNLSGNLLKKSKFIKGASLSLVGRNLFTLMSHIPGIDPETNAYSGNIQGLENSSLPPVRHLGFSVNFKF